MSNALLEAMASGLPCVVTDVGSNAEVLGDAGHPMLCKAGDSRSVALVLERLMSDEHLRSELGSAMRARAEAEYSMDRVCTAVLDLYDSLNGPNEPKGS